MAKNGSSTKRSKHIDIKYHFCKDQIKNHIISLKYCQTNMMVADILTKPIDRIQFKKFTNMLKLIDIKLILKQRRILKKLIKFSPTNNAFNILLILYIYLNSFHYIFHIYSGIFIRSCW